MSRKMDPLLQALFQYITRLSLPKALYVTGRPPISKKSLLKCLLFSIELLRQLVNILNVVFMESTKLRTFLWFHV